MIISLVSGHSPYELYEGFLSFFFFLFSYCFSWVARQSYIKITVRLNKLFTGKRTMPIVVRPALLFTLPVMRCQSHVRDPTRSSMTRCKACAPDTPYRAMRCTLGNLHGGVGGLDTWSGQHPTVLQQPHNRHTPTCIPSEKVGAPKIPDPEDPATKRKKK